MNKLLLPHPPDLASLPYFFLFLPSSIGQKWSDIQAIGHEITSHPYVIVDQGGEALVPQKPLI